MAEFCEVMKQAHRMCEAHDNSCAGCPLASEAHECRLELGYYDEIPECWNLSKLPEIERIVMGWAAANQEPRYPSWNEVWRQLFPDASNAPCPLYCVPAHVVKEYCAAPRKCAICRNQPIPADIAEKLGIKPMGSVNDV